MNDDAELLRRYVKDRSEAAFGELVHRHLDGIYSSLLRRVGGDAHLAQDAAQKVFVALARKSGALTNHPYLTGWLYAAAKAEAANLVRGEHRRKIREKEAHAMTETLAHPAPLDWSRLAPVLDEAIDELVDTDRRAVLQRFVDRRRYADIGAALGLTENAARMRTQRALEQLREILKRRGLVSTAAAIEALLAENAVGAVPAGVVSAITQAALAAGGAATTAGSAAVGAAVVKLLFSPLILGIAALAGSLTAAWLQYRSLGAAEAALTASQANYQRASARLKADQQRLASVRPTGAPNGSRARQGQGRLPASEFSQAFIARHPETQAAFLAFLDASNHAKYAAFCRAQNLTAEQIRQFGVLMRGNNGGIRFNMDQGEILFTPDGPRGAELRSDLRSLLGDAGFQAYQDYQRASMASPLATEAAADLIRNQLPLSSQQAEQLQAAMAQNFDPRVNAYDWDAILSAAPGFLAPDQAQVLGDLRMKTEAFAAMNTRRAK